MSAAAGAGHSPQFAPRASPVTTGSGTGARPVPDPSLLAG
jgi:hypothetical protein